MMCLTKETICMQIIVCAFFGSKHTIIGRHMICVMASMNHEKCIQAHLMTLFERCSHTGGTKCMQQIENECKTL